MAIINLIENDLITEGAAFESIDHSKRIFDEFKFVNYKNISKDTKYYLPLHIRKPYDVADIIAKIPNDIFLLMQQGVVRPLIVMVTEHWDLFDDYAWRHNKFNLTPDFANIPYSKMIQHFTTRAVPEENIIWLVPMDSHLKQIQFLREKGYSIKAKFIQYDYWLEIMKPFAKQMKITDRKFKNYFSCLCRGTPRNHRFGLVYEIWREGLVDKGNVSCEPYVELSESKQSNWVDDEISTTTFMDNFKDWSHNASEFKNKLPLTFDGAHNQHWGDVDESEIFSDSFLWIASETKKSHQGVYITEKTWKAIAYGSPFCINGDSGSLDYLHQRGYKTFNDYWDESYDQMDDINKINHIRNIIKDICSKDLTEINSLYKQMMPILEHNRQTLINNMQHNNLIQELSNG